MHHVGGVLLASLGACRENHLLQSTHAASPAASRKSQRQESILGYARPLEHQSAVPDQDATAGANDYGLDGRSATHVDCEGERAPGPPPKRQRTSVECTDACLDEIEVDEASLGPKSELDPALEFELFGEDLVEVPADLADHTSEKNLSTPLAFLPATGEHCDSSVWAFHTALESFRERLRCAENVNKILVRIVDHAVGSSDCISAQLARTLEGSGVSHASDLSGDQPVDSCGYIAADVVTWLRQIALAEGDAWFQTSLTQFRELRPRGLPALGWSRLWNCAGAELGRSKSPRQNQCQSCWKLESS